MSLTITIPGAVNVTTGSTAPAVLTIGVGVPGAQGPQGPAGQGVPTGGTAGQFLTKIDGTNYNTDWTTVNLSVYAVKANNLSDLTSASTARTNLGLGTMATASAADYSTTTVANGLYYPLSGNPSSFLTASALTGYATQSFVAANYAPIAAGLPTGGTVGQVLTKNSGTDYDDSWQTLIPGDRYVTTSTTSNTIGNGAKTFTVGTGLSYSSQQDVVISYDASNHMHAVVTSYNSGTGVLVVDVRSHTGSGTYTSWTINVGGTTPLQTVEWGEILGVLGDQTDLATALNAKLETSTAASTYAALAGATFTGEVITPASTTSNAGLTITPGVAPSAPSNGEIWATTNDLQVRLNGVTETIAEQSWVTAQGYLTSAPVTSVAGRTGAITLAVGDVSGAAALAGATFTGLVGTPASTTTTAGLNVPHGAAPTTPVNGDVWTTTSGLFWRQNGSTKQTMNLGDTQTVSGNITFSNASLTLGNSTAASTYNLGTGATLNATTKAINIGTAGVSGSTTNITIGSAVSGALGTTTVNGNITATGTTLTLGNSTAASTINVGTGATLSGSTKTINIGTNGVIGSTNVINIGPTATSGNINFNNNSVALGSNSTATTAAADTNSTALATTAFVVGQAGSATPLVDGTAAVGTSLRYARQDHVHPTDTTRAALASPAFTGTPTAPTATAGTNTTQIATTAFVTAAVPAFGATADINDPVSTTRAASIDNVRDILMSNGYQLLYQGAGSTGTSGTGAAVNNNGGRWKEYVSANSAVAGHAKGVYDTPAASIGIAGYQRGANLTSRNWSKKVWMTGRCMIGHFSLSTYNGSANTWARVTLGGYTAIGAGDMSASNRGIGWRVQGGGTSALELQVSNGTTVTTVTSSFTPTLQQCFDWEIYSDGAGNVTLFVNDSQVATTNAGPTGTQTSGLYMEGVDSTASSTAAFILNNLGTKIFFAI